MQSARLFFDRLNHAYLTLHQREGELYWATHTGQSAAHDALAAASLARKTFLADATQMMQSREHLLRLERAAPSSERDMLIAGLRGWIKVFECNAMGSERAAALLAELLRMDADLFARRQAYRMHHLSAAGQREEASPAALRANLASNPDEAARRSSHDALNALERWVLDNGFLEIVAKRNALARELGYRNFFEYRLKTNSAMTAEQLFAVFDAFERDTRDVHHASLKRLAETHGDAALQPHNLLFKMRGGGGATAADAYFPLSKSLERWVESFQRLGVSYRGARVEIDLLERQGKFPTGFCVAPTPGYDDDINGWVPADVRFTSTARPGQAGSGLRGLNVLFHEAGHAAHLSNVTLNSPCFTQEFAPTSPAFLEAQAKFFDALPGDPCWIRRYARNTAGEPMPEEMIRERVEMHQTLRAYTERRDLVPTYFEYALYAMDDAQRTTESVLDLARSVTQRILGIADHTDYVLTIPHPIYHEIAVYYHGYLLAKMAAAQTRGFLTRSLGYIVDNPAVGPLLTRHCWATGNSVTLDETLQSLTGEALSASWLAAECNRSPQEAWALSEEARAGREWLPSGDDRGDIDASIVIVHGAERIATNGESLQAMYAAFEAWMERNSPTP